MAKTPKAIDDALSRADCKIAKTPECVCNGMVKFEFTRADHRTAEGAARKIDYLASRVKELGEWIEEQLNEGK